MILGWLQRRRRRAIQARPFPATWRAWLAPHAYYARLPEEARGRLERTVQVLVAEKTWEGCGGLEVDDEMRVVISAQAALLVLELEHDYYADVTSILVYPSTYASSHEQVDEYGVTSVGHALLGEAHYRGPVVLAWDAALHGAVDPRDGCNVVLHEFAHRLDALDRSFDGTPPLHRREDYADWRRVMTAEFERLQRDLDRGRRTVLDPYAATNEAEFFAVATETFFEKPRALRHRHPELYEQLARYYRQDPAAGSAP